MERRGMHKTGGGIDKVAAEGTHLITTAPVQDIPLGSPLEGDLSQYLVKTACHGDYPVGSWGFWWTLLDASTIRIGSYNGGAFTQTNGIIPYQVIKKATGFVQRGSVSFTISGGAYTQDEITLPQPIDLTNAQPKLTHTGTMGYTSGRVGGWLEKHPTDNTKLLATMGINNGTFNVYYEVWSPRV